MSSITEGTLNEGKTAVTVYVTPGEQVSVSTKKIKKPNYFMVGNGTMNKDRIYGMDLLRELADSTKPEQFLILAIKDGIGWGNDYDPVVKVIGTTSTEKQYIKKAYPLLNERDLVRRIKRGHYMINPNALIPIDYNSAIQLWDSLKP